MALRLKRDPDPGEPHPEFRRRFIEVYDRFMAEIGGLSPEREQALLRILADAHANFAALDTESYKIIDELGKNPSPANAERREEFRRSGIALYRDIQAEAETRIDELLTDREQEAFHKHFWRGEVWWWLQYGEPIQPQSDASRSAR